jgi:hypothetical protein
LFVVPGFDELPEIVEPFAREWNDLVRDRRRIDLRMGEVLVVFQRFGVIPNLKPMSVAEFGARHGLSRREAMEVADVGVAVEKVPALKADVKRGDVSIETVGLVGRVVKNEALAAAAPLSQWRQEALENTADAFKEIVQRRTEEARTGAASVVPMTFHLPESTTRKFRRAREVASKQAKKWLTEGQTFEVVVEHYLVSHDPERVTPGKRRMPFTCGRPGRHVPAEVKRRVLGRHGGRCAYPGCRNRAWVDLAHVVAHRHGGSREADNLCGLCPYHHDLYDRGMFRIEGPPDAPRFYDRRGRMIGPQGRPIEHGEDAATEHAPPA